MGKPTWPGEDRPASREFVQNVYMRVVEKDASGRFVNREFRTFEMQPDYGRIQNVSK